MKTFFWTAVAVFGGIFLYMKLTGRKLTGGAAVMVNKLGNLTNVDADAVFYGPAIDPITGAYLNKGALPGTVEFNAQDN